jgi:multicomponent Na+:H+ antiporter subunit G
MSALDLLSLLLLLASGVFFLGGTVGLLRFPDTFSRLHALTKADNLGLGLLVLALMPQVGSVSIALKMALIWVLVMAINSAANYLVARHAVAIEQRREAGG